MSDRTLKIAARVRESLPEIMPSISKEWIEKGCSITSVAMTKDLSIAKVFVMVLRGDNKELLKQLNSLSRVVGHKVAKTNCFRRVPQVRFMADESYEEAKKLQAIGQMLAEDARVE